MDQNFNIQFVQKIKMYPELYNYMLKSYSKRNITDKAWSEEATEVKHFFNLRIDSTFFFAFFKWCL